MSSGNRIQLFVDNKKLKFRSDLGIPTQAESQKIEQIIQVLDELLDKKMVNATELEKTLPVSRDSIDRTLRLLQNYKMIKRDKTALKNKKYYRIQNRNSVIIYRDKLLNWSWIKEFQKDKKKIKKIQHSLIVSKDIPNQIRKIVKKAKFRKRKTSDILKKPLKIKSKNITKPTLIRDLPFSKARIIIRDYLKGDYCEECLEKDLLCKLKPDNSMLEKGCGYGHVYPIVN